MAICKHADIQAIEQFQPAGNKARDTKTFPFKTKATKRGTLTCFGDEWCKLHSENPCPQYTTKELQHSK